MGKSLAGMLACAFVLGAGVMGCGGPPAPQAPDLGSLSIAPPAPPVKTSGPVAIARPENVIAWVRLDDFDGLLDLIGVSAQSLGSNAMLTEILPYYEALETHRPIDVIVLAAGKRAKDVEVAARFGLRDPKGFFRAVSQHYDVVERGDRIIVQKQTPHADRPETRDDEQPEGEVVMVCDLAGTAAERATCGSEAAMDSVAEWLRAGPEPRAEDSVRTAKGGAIGRAILYGNALRKVIAAHDPPRHDPTERSLLAFLEDIDVVSIDLAREDENRSFVLGTRLRSASSTIAKEMLAKPNDDKPGDPFFRIWQDGSAVVFTPGGGSLPQWSAELVESISTRVKDSGNDPSAAAKALGKTLEKPVTIGYGVRIDHAKTALAAVRSAKDPEKAMAALERALDEYLVYSVPVEPAAAERALKDVAAHWTSSNEDYQLHYNSSYPATRYVVRTAPAKLGLSKGSFFLDITSADWRHYAGGANNAVKTKTDHVVHVPIAGATWGLTCPDDKTCAESAKKLAAPASTQKRALDPLFERKGIAFAGYVSSLVGAFTMHRMSLGAASGGVPNDVLTEIEHDLASPRLEMPFVVTTEKQGEGGTVAFEMRGERDAFKVLGEHAGLGGGSGLGILVYAAMMLRH